MSEDEFWVSLEFRVCREFAGMSQNHIRGLWCDGFESRRWSLDEPRPRIVGRAWICSGPRQAEWDFTLFLPHPVASREEIDWAALLPPENVTRWLSLDFDRKLIQIEPGAAVPDPA